MHIKTNQKVDWITLTYKGMLTPPDADGMGLTVSLMVVRHIMAELLPTFDNVFERVKTNAFYVLAFKHLATGIVVHVPHDIETQGMMIVLNGTTCAALGNDLQVVMRNARDGGYKCTRIDIAIDIFNAASNVKQFADEYVAEFEGKPPRKWAFISGKTGDTFNLGSRNSPKFLRVYEKGKQQGTKLDWVRVELEAKEHAASGLFNLACENVRRCVPTIAAMIPMAFNPLAMAVESIAEGEVQVPSTAPKPKSNTELWVDKTVIPALVKVADSDEDYILDFVERLLKAFKDDAERPRI